MNTLSTLLWLRFRRDRVQLAVWILAFAVLAAVGRSAATSSYGGDSERAEVVSVVMTTPTLLLLRGTPQGSAPEAFQFFLIFAFLSVLVGLMSTFLAVRHTRADEEAGRAELVGSTPAGRIAPLVATAIEGVALNLAVGLVTAVFAIASGADAAGGWLSGAALAAVGIAYFGVGLFCAQLMRTSRGANGLAAAIVIVGYLLRGLGDATGTRTGELTMDPGWLSWLSPIGWGQAVAPYTTQNWWPLLLCVAVGGVLFAASAWMQSHRDLDSSVIPDRAGRQTAPRSLSGPVGLVWRLQRNPVIGWVIAGGLFGLLVGSLGQTIVDLTNSAAGSQLEDTVGQTLGSLAGPGAEGTIIDLFTSALFALVGALAAVAGVQAVIRARQDEAGGTAEIVLAAPVSRIRWFLAYLAIGASSVLLVVGFAVLGGVLGVIGTPDAGERMLTIVEAGLAQLPAASVVLAVAALAFAVLPRLSIGLAWGVLLAAVLLGQFGGLFGLDEAVRDISPFSHTPSVTASDVDWGPAWVMLGITVVVAAAAAVFVRRRDLALG